MKQFVFKAINELCSKITDGAHFSPSEEQNGIYPMYSSKDMLYNGFDDKDVKMISKNDYDRLVKQDCRPLKDDILIIKDGNNYLKQVFKVKSTLEAVILSSIAILRPNKKSIDPDYFTYVLRTNSVRKAMGNYVSGAAIPRVVLKDFKKMKLKLHEDIDTQNRIASILSAYDNLIENNNKRIRLLEQMAENLYKEWFVRFRFPGHEKTEFENGLPKGWSKGSLGDVMVFQNGFAFKSESFMDEGRYSIVTIKNVKDDGFDGSKTDKIGEIPPKMPNYCKLSEGDILISLTGNVGRVCRVFGKDYLLNQRVAKVKSDYNYYIYSLLRTDAIFAALNNISYGTAQLNLSPVKAKKIKIIVPPDSIQKKFNDSVSTFFQSIDVLKTKNDLLSRQRDLLLPRLMSGKLEVK